MEKKGTVYWITGLSGSGKSTIADRLRDRLQSLGQKVICFDGDNLREILGNHYGYSMEDRQKLGLIYGKLCRFISLQGIDVICATISMFKICWEWNRKNIRNYFQIYLKVPKDVLVKRDYKGIYSGVKNVVGVDLNLEEPVCSDLVILNDGDKSPEEICNKIISLKFLKAKS